MFYRLFTFPMLEDGIVAIEKKLYELENREKNGERLEPEEKDWMDFANNVVHNYSNTAP